MAYNPGYHPPPPGPYPPGPPGPQFGGPPVFPPGPGYPPGPPGPGGMLPRPEGIVPPPEASAPSPVPGQPYTPPNLDSPPVYNPALPYVGPLPRLQDGALIVIRGFIPVIANNFHINLSVGAGTNEKVDNAIHIKPCFHEKLNEVVRNNYTYGQWGTEEKWGTSPLNTGENFESIILITDQQYKIAFNGNHFCEFNHRIPKESVTHLTIEGDVMVNSIFVQKPASSIPPDAPPPYVPVPGPMPPPAGPPMMPGPPMVPPPAVQPPPPPVQPQVPQYTTPVPYQQKLRGGIRPGMVVKISGRVKDNAKEFQVNFCYFAHTKTNVAFHFNPRMNETQVVRNSRNGTKWGREERSSSTGTFPFGKGCPFEITFRIFQDKYDVIVDGTYFTSYGHRLRNFSNTDYLNISGDVELLPVEVHG